MLRIRHHARISASYLGVEPIVPEPFVFTIDLDLTRSIDLCVNSKARVHTSRLPRPFSACYERRAFVGQNPGFLDWQNPPTPPPGRQSAQNGPKRPILTQNRGTPPKGGKKGPKRPKNPYFWYIQGGTLGCDTFTAGFYEEIGF